MSEPAIPNRDQAEAWNADEGVHWATHQDRYDAMSGAFTEPLLGGAAIGDADVVLDIGCGNGQSTREAARRASRGRAVGLDLSAPMLERARATAATEGITNVTFDQGDAQVHPLPDASFDAAISRFGIMFFDDPVAAFTNIGRALRPGGRLSFVCWQDIAANEWLMVPLGAALQHLPPPDLGPPGAPGPFSLAGPARIREVLTTAGFDRIEVDPVEELMRLGDDADDTVEFLRGTGMAQTLLANADAQAASRALDAIAEVLRPCQQDQGLYLTGAAWLVTARRP